MRSTRKRMRAVLATAAPGTVIADNFEISTIVPGEDPVALPPQNPRKDNWPDWSPDGKKIVWWHQAPAGNFDVYVMNGMDARCDRRESGDLHHGLQ